MEERRLKRGDVAIVAMQGEYGKVRPAIIIQTDALFDIPSVVIVPCTSEIVADCIYRPDIHPDPENGLQCQSQAMTDKIAAVPLRRVREIVGTVSADTLRAVEQAAQFVIGTFD